MALKMHKRPLTDVSVTPLKPPPRSEESERAMIGSLLLDCASAWPAIRDIIEPDHLWRADNRVIFEAVAELVERGVEPDTPIVVDHLERTGKLADAGGREYIIELVEDTASAANAAGYAAAVRESAERRKWIDIAANLTTAAREGTAGAAAEYAATALGEYQARGALRTAKPLTVEPVSAWAHRPAPAPREWVVEGMIPAGRVASLLGNGGLGKTLLAVQLGVHIATGRDLFGTPVSGGPVLGIFCEDEQDELERRWRSACAGEGLSLADVDRFYALSRDGQDSLLCTFERDHIKLTAFYHELEATVRALEPRLLILDTAADLFAGDFMSTPQVRQFLKIALGGLCVRYGCAILLLAHPSASAMSTGDGGGFSTAWNNSVRSRLYLRRPKGDDPEEAQDRRVLEVRKSNYAADGNAVPLLFQDGYFVRDPDPIDESPAGAKRSSAPTKAAFSLLEYVRRAEGLAVPFGDILDYATGAGVVPADITEAAKRKQVQRALRSLCDAELVRKCQMPRGHYRAVDGEHGESKI